MVDQTQRVRDLAPLVVYLILCRMRSEDTIYSVMTIPEAARCLKVSERTIARLIADGQLHAPKIRRRRLVSKAAIEALLRMERG